MLVYAVSSDEPAKRRAAREVLRSDDLALSAQVLQEFYVVATARHRPRRLDHDDAVAMIRSLRRFPVRPVDDLLVLAATAASRRWEISYWDAAILEAARSMGCETVLSEDLSQEQDYDGIGVDDPFS